MCSGNGEEMELWRYTTTSELLYIFEKSQLPTNPISELLVGSEIPEQDCAENMASLVWEKIRHITEYSEWYAEPGISRSTWDRFANSTVALKSTKATILSQVPDQTVHVVDTEYTEISNYSVSLPTDGRGNYPINALGDLFGVKSSTFDHEHTVRVLAVPGGVLNESDETISYTSLDSFDGSRPEITVAPEEFIQSVEVSPKAPPYVKNVVEDYFSDNLGNGSLIL